MSLKVTIADIARELNTTAATVSRALNNHPAISAERRRQVQEAADTLNYRRNKIASSLRLGQTGLIGVIVPSAEINFFGSVVHGIESIANQNGFNVLIYQSNESREHEERGIETFLNARVDGIMVSIAKETSDMSHFAEAIRAQVPLIFFDRSSDELDVDSVVIDDFRGAYLATEHLIRQGYKRIGHIAGPMHLKIFKDRLQGYEAALMDYGMEARSGWIYPGYVSIESGREAVRTMLSSGSSPDALFAVEDFTALGAIKELKEQNLRIPEDMGIIGFANEAFGEHITPSLSSIDQQTVRMGKESSELMLKLIAGKGNLRQEVKKIVLEPVPIYRNSSIRV